MVRIRIKQVVVDLAESEEGMALVALCAALGTAYEPFFSAQVLREFCQLSGAPRDITPALRQWEMLVNLCAGILSSGGFMDKVNGFNRLVFGHPVDYRSPKCEPTTHGDLAKAITVIAEVAQRRKANASFVGGLDCAWLAALAEWVLSLDVSVVDSSGTVLYRSRLKVRELPQVTILIPECPSKSLLSSQTSIIPPGNSVSWLAPCSSEEDQGGLHRRSSRSSILRDTFGSSIDKLSELETAQWFALYLESSSMLQRPDPRHSENLKSPGDAGRYSSTGLPLVLDCQLFNYPMEPLLWAQESRKLRHFRTFASQYLPELTKCLQSAEPVVSQGEAESLALRALESIDAAWPYSLGQNDTGTADSIDQHQIRVKTLVQVITIFLWIMFVTDVEDDVCPSINGLANLYAWCLEWHALDPQMGEKVSWPKRMTRHEGTIRWLDLVYYCFSGLSDEDHDMERLGKRGELTRAGGGICVYYHALENPDIPPGSMVKLHVVRGYITYEGSQFDGIRDIPIGFQGHEYRLEGEELPDNSAVFTLDMMVQELNLASQLAASFHVHYLGIDGESHSIWLRLGDLYQMMQQTLRPRRCRGSCDPLYALKTSPHALCSWRNSSRDTLIINNEKTVEVQEAVESLRNTTTVWMLTSMKNQPSYCPSVTTTILGRPFFLYVLMSESDPSSLLTLSPFVRCLSCIVELGSWVPLGELRDYDDRHWEVDYGGVVELVVPDGSELEITWEESAQGKQRREEREQEQRKETEREQRWHQREEQQEREREQWE